MQSVYLNPLDLFEKSEKNWFPAKLSGALEVKSVEGLQEAPHDLIGRLKAQIFSY